MEFTRGNLALKEHLEKENRVFLFEYERQGHVRFEAELELFDFDFFTTHDRNGDLREGIKFFFAKTGAKEEIPILDGSYSKDIDPPFLRDLGNSYTTERIGLVTSRVGQGAYRKSIIHRWKYQCAVTKFDDTRMLIASHIVPWKDSTDKERLDVDNGILLSPAYDALFDRHLITFDEKGKIVLSSQILKESFLKIGVTGSEKLDRIHNGVKGYLSIHQDEFASTQN